MAHEEESSIEELKVKNRIYIYEELILDKSFLKLKKWKSKFTIPPTIFNYAKKKKIKVEVDRFHR